VSITHGPGVRGRPFAKGNAGRKRGSRNQASLIAAAMLEGEQPELLRIAIEIAKRGNVAMLKFFLARWLPRERLITIDLPEILSTTDALNALQRILRAVSAGMITPAEGAALTALLTPFIDKNPTKPGPGSPAPSLIDHFQTPDTEKE
jgi:hypothetical protein